MKECVIKMCDISLRRTGWQRQEEAGGKKSLKPIKTKLKVTMESTQSPMRKGLHSPRWSWNLYTHTHTHRQRHTHARTMLCSEYGSVPSLRERWVTFLALWLTSWFLHLRAELHYESTHTVQCNRFGVHRGHFSGHLVSGKLKIPSPGKVFVPKNSWK